jgi:uncharacterized membrane protein YgaE (UPF0421/DUF939 family)
MLNVLRLRLQGIGDWLSAADPGFIRTQLGLRAALATLTTLLVMLVISILLTGAPVLAVGLFGAVICFLVFLVINDPFPADRRVTMLLAIFPLAAAITLASLLVDLFWIRIITLLALLFLSFYLRRYGLRALELSLLAALGYYYASLIGVRPNMLVILLLSVGVGLASAFVFQFVFLPADPLRSTRRAIGVFYRLVAETIGETARSLDDKVTSAGWDKLLQRRMRQIHYARSVIDSQLAAAAAALPLQWTLDRIIRLQVALYRAEQGLGLMGEGAKALREKLAEFPDDVERSLIRTLIALQDAVAHLASAESVAELHRQAEELQARARARLADGQQEGWAYPALRLSVGGVEVSRAVQQVRTLDPNAGTVAASVPQEGTAVLGSNPTSKGRPTPPLVAFIGMKLHPTTALGIQAVVATALAMSVAVLFGSEHPSWMYWSAFGMVVGSTGESLRRMPPKIIGTVGGAFAGVALALLYPDTVYFIAIVVGICIFMVVVVRPTSYPWMVFWTTMAFAQVYTSAHPVREVLIARPLNTLAGAVIAALTVYFVVPVRAGERFKRAIGAYLKTVDAYLAHFAATLADKAGAAKLSAVEIQVSSAYAALEQLLPSVAYEYNALTRVNSPLTQQQTALAAIHRSIRKIAEQVMEGLASLEDQEEADLITVIQTRIHENLQSLVTFLAGNQKGMLRSLAEVQSGGKLQGVLEQVLFQEDEAGVLDGTGRRVLFHLTRLHQTIMQLADGLGARIQEPDSADRTAITDEYSSNKVG